MLEYLDYQFRDSADFVETYDELPLWSAPFGLLLLNNLELKAGMRVLDVGCGAGFPLLELAGRLGNSCRLFGLDPWEHAANRVERKIRNYGLGNVTMIRGNAEHIPMDDNTLDLVISNLGINNFESPAAVFRECRRVLKPGGRLALSTNLNGHWQLFYDIFEKTLRGLGLHDQIEELTRHQEHRGSVQSISALFTDNGFRVRRHITESFDMNFLDGSAFLHHYFIKLGWLESWKNLVPPEALRPFFSALEQNLNEEAARSGSLKLRVPAAFVEGE